MLDVFLELELVCIFEAQQFESWGCGRECGHKPNNRMPISQPSSVTLSNCSPAGGREQAHLG